MPVSAKEKIIVALDFPDRSTAEASMKRFAGLLDRVKIGLQLFTAEGPDIVRVAHDLGFRVFLDLKFHDIPNTVRHAVASAGKLGVEMATVHALGSKEMLRTAAEEAASHGVSLLAVTLLTSMDPPQCEAVAIPLPIGSQVLRLASLAAECGIPGVVASPLETASIRAALGSSLRVVTPGIRPPGSPAGDQKRFLTPAQAIRAGADFLVVGRPITAAPDPLSAIAAINEELSSPEE